MKFNIWINENIAAGQIGDVFGSLADNITGAAKQKIEEYVKRILSGEKPEVVLSGLNPNGKIWKDTMDLVNQAKQQQINSNDNTINEFDKLARQLENKFQLTPNSLVITNSQDGKWIHVRNRLNGKTQSIPDMNQQLENAAKKII